MIEIDPLMSLMRRYDERLEEFARLRGGVYFSSAPLKRSGQPQGASVGFSKTRAFEDRELEIDLREFM